MFNENDIIWTLRTVIFIMILITNVNGAEIVMIRDLVL